MSLPQFILRRILQAIPLLFLISLISFAMLKLAPIDPLAYLKANPAISQATIKAEEERLGLNKPAAIQYLIWLKNLIHGDLGISTTGGSVFWLIMHRAGNTLLLGSLSVLATWLIAIPAGVYAAVHRGQWLDNFFAGVASTYVCCPIQNFADRRSD